MGQMLSVEDEEWSYLITTRTAGSKLWLLNNNELEAAILGCLARYQTVYEVVLYAFVLMGNHYHLVADFPKMNRAEFMRDFNSQIARLVGRKVKAHGRRSVWARRYAYQILPLEKDVRNWFFYVALNPVSSGIVRNIDSYPAYNSFFDACSGTARIYRWVNWSKYLMAKRYDKNLSEDEFAIEYKLTFSRLPGTENLSDTDYKEELTKELKHRNDLIIKERLEHGKGFLGLNKLRSVIAGAAPRSTKRSSRHSFRPIVLSLCTKTRKAYLKLFMDITNAFLSASKVFRSGENLKVLFPSGTYPPPRPVCI